MACPKTLRGKEGLFLFLAPFLLGLLLRLSLVREGLPFWYDEIWTANFAAFPLSWDRVMGRLLGEDSHPSLAYLLYRLWAGLLGLRDPVVARSPEVEAGLRLFSALLGAGVLYALAPIALMREAEVHVYPAATFFTTLALLL